MKDLWGRPAWGYRRTPVHLPVPAFHPPALVTTPLVRLPHPHPHPHTCTCICICICVFILCLCCSVLFCSVGLSMANRVKCCVLWPANVAVESVSVTSSLSSSLASPRLASATATAGQQEQQRVVELRMRLSWDRVGVGTFQRAAYKLINKVPKKFSCGQSRECLTRKTLCTHAGECKFCTQCERTEKESTMNESQWGNTWGPSRAFDRFKFPHLFANSCTRNSFDSNSKTIFGTPKLTVNQMKLG